MQIYIMRCRRLQLLISKSLLQKAHITIRHIDRDIIMNTTKLLVFHDNSYLVKRNGDKLFHLEMGSCNGVQVADLVGLYIFDTLKKEIKEANNGLYKNDGHDIQRG